MRFAWLMVLAICGLLAGCGQAAVVPYITAAKDASNARMYAEMLRHGDFDQLDSHLDPIDRDPHDREMFERMAADFPGGEPQTIKVVGLTVPNSAAASRTDVSLEYEFPGQWVLVTVALRGNDGGVATLVGFRVQLMADSLEHLNRFNLDWKTPDQYLILAAGVCSLLFSLYVVVLCAQTKGIKIGWLWSVFSLVGVGSVTVNWTTGQWSVTVLSIGTPTIRAYHSPYGPWSLVVYLPVGALLLLRYRWTIEARGEVIAPRVENPTPPPNALP